MSASYAVAILRDVNVGDDIVEYLRRIDATLTPFEGRFIIHGASPDVREGTWDAALFQGVDRDHRALEVLTR